MKKLILLSIVFLSAQHVYADIECRIARECSVSLSLTGFVSDTLTT